MKFKKLLKSIRVRENRFNAFGFYNGLLVFFIILLDQVTKLWALKDLIDKNLYINNFLYFSLSKNTGISWGLFSVAKNSINWPVIFLVIILILVLRAYIHYKQMYNLNITGEVLVLGGAIGNLVDRLNYNGVIDFIVIDFGSWTWPAFNLADMAIVIGVGIMLITGRDEKS